MMATLLLIAGSVLSAPAIAADEAFTRTEDVIYGRKFGTALTLDVFTPKENANGAAIVWVVSGGWYSGHEAVNAGAIGEYLRRGYTVFAVVHGSQPKFTIPEVLEDMHRSVRFIRSRAEQYQIDPNRIGITGGSAGGHLSLMQGTAGTLGSPDAKDPVDRLSSRVQAVACFFPPTDFLNYGKPGENALGRGVLKDFRAPFDFHEFDNATRAFVPIIDEERILTIGRSISPVNHVSKDDPPTLIIHGDADLLVPIQQAELILEALKAEGVPTELVVKKGLAHGWPEMGKDAVTLADWFDKHLAGAGGEDEPKTVAGAQDGVWKPIAAVLGGVPLPEGAVKAITLKVTDGRYEVTIEGEGPDKGTCTLDTTTTPKRMTIIGTDGPNQGKTILAIYEMKDAVSMRVCYDLSGTEFPKEFKAPKGSQLYLVGYRRQTEESAEVPEPK